MSEDIDSECVGVTFLGEPKVATLASAEDDIDNLGMSLVSEEPQVDVKLVIRPCLTGPFILPEEYMPVSPAYLFKTATQPSEAIKIRVQHCIHLKTEEDCSKLKVFFATTTPVHKERKPFYEFKVINGLTGIFSIGNQNGEISVNKSGLFLVATQHIYGM